MMLPQRGGRIIQRQIWRVEIIPLQPRHVELPGVGALVPSRLYYLRGELILREVTDICERLLCDPVVERYEVRSTKDEMEGRGQQTTEGGGGEALLAILPKPGVMDAVAESTRQAIADLGYAVDQVRTGRVYRCAISRPAEQLRMAVERQLANALVDDVYVNDLPGDPFVEPTPRPLVIRRVAIRELHDEALLALSRQGHLFLDLHEMRAIRDHYRALGREPTDVELETLAQTWSEHCVHKTLKSEILYSGPGFPDEVPVALGNAGSANPPPHIERCYTNLLKDTIVRATQELNKPWCLSVFEDNAGIIEFDEQHGVAFKVETHNHPTALEPYGGASTGVGGCIRDIMGCGLGARPVANTDVFCLAPPDLPGRRIPRGVIHPARTLREVVHGVRDYGNRMGIPTVNGAIHFDNRYLANPLVFCGCVGLIPKDRIRKVVQQADRIVLVGGRTGRDGIHGATFSSGGMTDTHAEVFAHAVQIGNAITQKKVLDVLLQARDHAGGCLYHSVTDCGAGGLSSAVGEMAAELGAVVELDQVPLKYAGLSYDDIWISEAQERMVLAVPQENVPTLIALCHSEDVEATDIGEFGAGGKLLLKYDGRQVGELDTLFLHTGLPRRCREARWQPPQRPPTACAEGYYGDLHDQLLAWLSSPNIASKEWVIRQYDHEVQGGSVIKPLMGPGRGPCDAAVVRPMLQSERAIILSCGLCPSLSDVDPYVMAVAAVDEAIRNNISVGGDLARLALLDNFCWGDVSDPQELGALVRAAQGCHDAALAYGAPFISGKDSLNNVFEMNAEDAARTGWPARMTIPGTLLISALSVIPDSTVCRTSDLKQVSNRLLLVRPRGRRLADLATAARAVCTMLREIPGLRSCHDVSDGGWLVAAAEMVIGSRYGLNLRAPDDDLFGERFGTYLLEVSPSALPLMSVYDSVEWIDLGEVIESANLVLTAGRRQVVWSAAELRASWQRTFDWK